MLLKLYDLLA